MIRMHSNMMIYIYGVKLFIVDKFIGFHKYLIYDLFLLQIMYICSSIDFEMELGRTGYLIGFIRTYAHRQRFDIWVDMERLGPVLMDAVLPIPPAIFVINDEAGAGIDGCSAPDTASEFI